MGGLWQTGMDSDVQFIRLYGQMFLLLFNKTNIKDWINFRIEIQSVEPTLSSLQSQFKNSYNNPIS